MIQNAFIKERNQKLGNKTVINLQKRYFDAYYVDTKEEALQKAIELIPKTDVVAWGGSVSIAETGLINHIKENGYSVIDRDSAKSPEERTELIRKSLLCDTYLMGTNAISEDGQLVNIDGTGNRVAALIYGPKSVVIISSVNKIMPTLEDAIKRARTVAAPINMQKIAKISERNTPCVITGTCANCTSNDSICAQMVITRLCKPKGRIKIILTGEEIGF
ncbi:lactate utilization protein [bacterium]|nr:lactate utilization protein [bacterium]